MGFLDTLADTAKTFGKAALAGPGAVYDIASSTVSLAPGVNLPGSADDNGWSSLFDSLGGRAGQLASPLTNSNTFTGKAFGKVMDGVEFVYHEGFDRPISTAFVMLSHLDPSDESGDENFGDLFSGEAWAKAYRIADEQSFGRSVVDAVSSKEDPFARAQDGMTPFENNEFVQDHPTAANLLSLGIEIPIAWRRDPFVLLGKGAGHVHRIHGLGQVRKGREVNLFDELDGGVEAAASTFSTIGKSLNPAKQNFKARFDGYFDFVYRDGKPLNAAEIKAVTPELRHGANATGVASALSEAMRIPGATREDHLNAARRVMAVAAGDVTQIDRLRNQITGGQAVADKLENLLDGSTLKLTRQALEGELARSPQLRTAFNKQLRNQDELDDVTEFVKGWRTQVEDDLKASKNTLSLQGQQRFVPGKHVTSDQKLRAAHGGGVLETVEKTHDRVVDSLRTWGQRDSYSTVWQQGLHAVPLVLAYPAKWIAATSPTKWVPAGVQGLKQQHYTGVINTHDWNGAVGQFDSMLRLSGVDNATRLGELSKAMKASTEAEKRAAVGRIEKAAMQGIANEIKAKHGIDVNPDWVVQTVRMGQVGRANEIGAINGGRIYSATKAPDEVAAKMRERLAQSGDEMEEGVDLLDVPRVDTFVHKDGVPLAMPVASTELANRIPLFDVDLAKKLTSDRAFAERYARLGDMWTEAARDLPALQARLMRATGSQAKRLEKVIHNKRKTLTAIHESASFMNRWWKVSVLFRLGYPMRVLADDHMRIAARMGYGSFMMQTFGEAARNKLYNTLPGWAAKNARKGQAKMAYARAKHDRSMLKTTLGGEWDDQTWAEIKQLSKTVSASKVSAEERAVAEARLRELDPEMRNHEFWEAKREVGRHARAIRKHERDIARWRAEQPEGWQQKVADAEAKIAERQGARDFVVEQLSGRQDPDDLRKQLASVNSLIDLGPKGNRAGKRRIGEGSFTIDGVRYDGAFNGTAAEGYRSASASRDSFDAIITDGEETAYNLMANGAHRTISPSDPAYYHAWAYVLNHQIRNSPEFMQFVKGEATNPDEWVRWLKQPENRHLRERMAHFAHDPEDWANRLYAMTLDYMPTPELRELVAKGRVSARELRKMFPDTAPRPTIHGQLADVNSGRHTVGRAFSGGIQRMFRYLSDVPTDKLSRHPYFNAVYKQEVKRLHAAHVAARKPGQKFTQADVDQIQTAARKAALGELKRTLWDVSAHSHMAHTMRFLSPFFAAHQEALMRWWNIASENPAIVRQFQMAFDIPRKMGLTYNEETGEVKPGEPIGPGNQIMLQIPFAGEDNPVNKWLLKMGGGKPWHINENGLNLILQNGIANPGVGPLVTIPTETIIQQVPEATEFEKAVRAMSPFPIAADTPLGVAQNALTPAWGKRLVSYFQKEGSAEYSRYFMQNLSDNLIAYNENNPGGGAPTDEEFDAIMDRSKKETARDLAIMGLTNVAWLTPGKPNSKYAVVQIGLQKLYEQMRQENHDLDWLRDEFKDKYGEIYMPMIYSMGINESRLDGTPGEVSALKKRAKLVGKVDPSLYRMIVGPDAAMSDEEWTKPSVGARAWMKTHGGSPYNDETYLGKRNIEEASIQILVNQGWRQYEELTNWLDVEAEKRGLPSYEADPMLMDMRSAGLQYIKENNEAFAVEWNEFARTDFEKRIRDMEQIAFDKTLTKDQTRTDIYWLQQYLALRGNIKAELEARAAAGGAKTIGAQANEDLRQMMAAGVSYINSQNTYFRDFHYHGAIEFDPYLSGVEVQGADSEG